MSVKLIDLSIILGNAVDNAIEAVGKLTDADRLIELSIYSEMEYLVIKVKNKYLKGAVAKDLSTTKADIDNHG